MISSVVIMVTHKFGGIFMAFMVLQLFVAFLHTKGKFREVFYTYAKITLVMGRLTIYLSAIFSTIFYHTSEIAVCYLVFTRGRARGQNKI